jgi:glucose/arabinose dehydrogenase
MRPTQRYLAVAALLALASLVCALEARPARMALAANGTWTGTYYNNMTLSGIPVLTEDDGPTLNFSYDGVTPPAPGVTPQNFSVSWSRTDTYAAGTYRFTATADDGIRVYVDGTLLIDQWVDQGATTFFDDKALSAGAHTVRVAYYNHTNGGVAALTIVDASTIPPGWIGQYYNNQGLSGSPVLTRNDGDTIDFQWNTGSPDLATMPTTHWSARWTRTLTFSEGVYSFATFSDDGVRVYVDGQLIIDHWVDQVAGWTANKEMTAGQHTVVVEYYQDLGGAEMHLTIAYRPDLGGFVTDRVASGFTLPTAFAMAPDGRILVALKDGTVDLIKNGVVSTFYTVSPVNDFHDRGLIGIALDPSFLTNGYVYLGYTYDVNPGLAAQAAPKTVQVIRVTANGDVADPASKIVLLGTVVGTAARPSCENYIADHPGLDPNTLDCLPSDGESHSVGALKIGPDGALYVALGDSASFNTVDPLALRAQDLTRPSGKILRVDRTTGQGLPDNPLWDGNASHVKSKVYLYGVRNDFRFNFKPGTNQLFTGDVGWDTWEEINVPAPGANLGWPCYEGNFQQGGYAAFAQCQALYAAGGTTFGIYTYDHSLGSAAVVGGAFTGANSYKSAFQNAYWWADYARNQISAFKVDASNQVVPGSLTLFANNADGPVDLEIGPQDGDVYYLAINAGELRHVRFVGDNRPPIAVASGTPAAGLAPLTVAFSSAGSYDPDAGQTITYDWNFGDGSPHDSTQNPTHKYVANGVYTATLTVTDPFFATSQATVKITVGNTPPVPSITSPVNGSHYDIGNTITFSGGATDAQDGTIPASSLSWNIVLFHCTDATFTSCHTHPFFSTTGAGGSFVVSDHGDFTYFVLTLTATDSGGLSASAPVTITPNRVAISFASSQTGAVISVDGTTQNAPFTHSVPRLSAHAIYAASPQTLGAAPMQWSAWSDGGANPHTIVALADATYTVTLMPVPTPTPTPSASPTATSAPTSTLTPTPTWTASAMPIASGTPPTSTATPVLTPTPCQGTICTCLIWRADVDGDGLVDITDLSLTAAHFLETPLTYPRLDQDGDGLVTIVDLGLEAGVFLQRVSSCPP